MEEIPSEGPPEDDTDKTDNKDDNIPASMTIKISVVSKVFQATDGLSSALGRGSVTVTFER